MSLKTYILLFSDVYLRRAKEYGPIIPGITCALRRLNVSGDEIKTMEIRRYTKNHLAKPELVDSSVFIAFWAEDKYVMGMDAKGQSWMLTQDITLQRIEREAPGVMRVHRKAVVRVGAIERLATRSFPAKKYLDHYCTVKGRELPISRRHKLAVYIAYQNQAARPGFVSMAVAA